MQQKKKTLSKGSKIWFLYGTNMRRNVQKSLAMFSCETKLHPLN